MKTNRNLKVYEFGILFAKICTCFERILEFCVEFVLRKYTIPKVALNKCTTADQLFMCRFDCRGNIQTRNIMKVYRFHINYILSLAIANSMMFSHSS